MPRSLMICPLPANEQETKGLSQSKYRGLRKGADTTSPSLISKTATKKSEAPEEKFYSPAQATLRPFLPSCSFQSLKELDIAHPQWRRYL